ncbi:DUF5403 family protein [Actinoplanes sp. NPDC049548]|uniref:DUF5403 family protein n=1 Tax=Actinoplanes sp. NPDC049548 TaxID=3155152 RepID=UPI0034190CA5
MAELLPDKQVNDIVSKHETVQGYLEAVTFDMAATADELLVQNRHDGHAEIDWEHADVDWFVTLSDERGQKAALSIEFGREPYTDEHGRKVGGMEGLYILTRATGIARKQKRQRGKP